jgi:hypothetical protein
MNVRKESMKYFVFSLLPFMGEMPGGQWGRGVMCEFPSPHILFFFKKSYSAS